MPRQGLDAAKYDVDLACIRQPRPPAARQSVVTPARNGMPDAAPRLLNIACPAGNEVDVAVRDGLARNLSIVDANVEGFHRGIFVHDGATGPFQEFRESVQFGLLQIKIAGHVSAWNDQCVQGSDWIHIPDNVAEHIGVNNAM